MSPAPRPPGPVAPAPGFTLIEVMAALVVFAAGVLVLLGLSGSISRQMEAAAVSSGMASRAEQQLDSLAGVPYAELLPGQTADTVVVRGVTYDRTVAVTQYGPLLRQVEVRMIPRRGVAPSDTMYAWVADRW